MKQKSEFSVIGRAMTTVAGFDRVYRSLEQQVTLRGQAKSTFENYIHRIAQVSLHFNCLPEDVIEEELNEYLAALALSAKSPSRSAFKHSVYGLRYYYRYVGLANRAVKLPSLKKDAKLPAIFNKSELRLLFKAPALLKHRVLLMLIYSAGLRSSEVINLKIADIDFERRAIHIRRSKYNKDRMIPLSEYMALGLKKYLALERPLTWLFNGKTLGMQYFRQSYLMGDARSGKNCRHCQGCHRSYAASFLCHPSDRRRAEHCHGQRPAGTFQDRNHHDLPSYCSMSTGKSPQSAGYALSRSLQA